MQKVFKKYRKNIIQDQNLKFIKKFFTFMGLYILTLEDVFNIIDDILKKI